MCLTRFYRVFVLSRLLPSFEIFRAQKTQVYFIGVRVEIIPVH